MWVTTVDKNPETEHYGLYLVRHALGNMFMTYQLQLSKSDCQFNEASPI